MGHMFVWSYSSLWRRRRNLDTPYRCRRYIFIQRVVSGYWSWMGNGFGRSAVSIYKAKGYLRFKFSFRTDFFSGSKLSESVQYIHNHSVPAPPLFVCLTYCLQHIWAASIKTCERTTASRRSRNGFSWQTIVPGNIFVSISGRWLYINEENDTSSLKYQRPEVISNLREIFF